MATWPTTLPACIQLNTWARKEGTLVLKSEMDAGKPKRRKRFSTSYPTVPVTLTLTLAQYQTLDTFYLANPAIPFTWTDPLTLASAEIVFDSRPDITSRNGAKYIVQFSIEIQL